VALSATETLSTPAAVSGALVALPAAVKGAEALAPVMLAACENVVAGVPAGDVAQTVSCVTVIVNTPAAVFVATMEAGVAVAHDRRSGCNSIVPFTGSVKEQVALADPANSSVSAEALALKDIEAIAANTTFFRQHIGTLLC
jgi:hypothetical protein